MTKSEFINQEFETAMAELKSEYPKRFIDYEEFKDLVIDKVALDKIQEAVKLLQALVDSGFCETDDVFWYYDGKQEPQLVECYEDVEFLLDEDDEGYLPEANDDYYYKTIKGVKDYE